MLKITLKKSSIGAIPAHKKTLKALGLNKTGSTVVKRDNPAMRGMIHQIKHLLSVESVD